jgi:hypothetical protein
MAAPHVSGLAALYRQMYPEKTNTQIMEMLLSSTIEVQADQTFNMGEDNTYGMGFIDATHKSISTSFSAKDQAGNLIDGSFSISETYFGYSFEVDEFYVESGGSSNTSFGHNISKYNSFRNGRRTTHFFALEWRKCAIHECA